MSSSSYNYVFSQSENSTVWTHLNPRPQAVLLTTEYLGYVITVLSFACYVLLVWVVRNKSPKEMGAYKWYIIWNASLTAAFEMLYGIAHPEPLYPYIMLMSGGLAKNVELPPVAAVLYVDVVFFLVISVVVSTMFLFTFRYSQTVKSRLADWLSNWKMVVPIVAAILVVCTATIVVPFHVLSYTGERIRKHFDPGVQDAVHGRLAVGYEQEGFSWEISTRAVKVLGGVTILVVVSCTFGCYNHLRRHKKLLSLNTRRLYKSLLNALVIDMLISAVTILLPVVACNFCVLSESQYTSIVFAFTLTIASLYPLATNVVLLTYLTPYRKAVLELLSPTRRRIRSNSVFQLSTAERIRRPSVLPKLV